MTGVMVKVIRRSCSAMELPESARHLLGMYHNKNISQGEKRRGVRANKPECQFAGSGQAVRSG